MRYRLPLFAAGAAFGVLGFGLWYALAPRAEMRTTRARLAAVVAEVESLRKQNAAEAQENSALRQRLGETSAALDEGMSALQKASRKPPPPRPDESPAMRQLRESLAAANAIASRLEDRAREFEAQSKKDASEIERLAALQEEAKDRLASMNRLVEVLQAEVKSKDARLTQLEVAAKKQRDEVSTAAQQGLQVSRVVAELEDVNRRRELHLSSMLTRYREITEQYRALYAMLDSRRDHEQTASAGSLGTTEFSRIQNALSLADDDLRQVSGLNAQIQRLQRKLQGK